MIPEGVHIRDIEDQPPPVSRCFTLFQIEDRRLRVSCAQGRETCALPTIKKLHAQNISVKPHRLRQFTTRKVTAEIFSIVGAIRDKFTSAPLESSFREAYPKF
jgi:hypothetical protein